MSIRKIKRRKMRAMGASGTLSMRFSVIEAEYLASLTQAELSELVDAAINHAMRR